VRRAGKVRGSFLLPQDDSGVEAGQMHAQPVAGFRGSPPQTAKQKLEYMVNIRWFTKTEVLALVVVVLIGLVYLPQPFHDDQAFFTVAAIKLNHGALLYRDYWDIKQPGIFGFYLLGGKLFGFNEVGIHGFELLYMTFLAVVLMVTLRKYLEYAWASALVVLMTVGFYYGVSGLPHATQNYLTQVEGVVGLPMFLCLWFASQAAVDPERRWARWFMSGVMGACVLLLKLIFLPIICSFWAASFLYLVFRERKNILSQLVKSAFPVVLGVVVPLLMVCVYFAQRGGLHDLYFTSFVWPVRALGMPLAGPGRLHAGLEFFVDGFAPLLALGFLGVWWSWRKHSDIVTINLVLWIVMGAAAILIQRRSWWPYHYMLLFVPLGILGTRGVECLWEQLQVSGVKEFVIQRRRALIFALILLFSPVIFPIFTDAMLLARYRFGATPTWRRDFQNRYANSQYPGVLTETAFLSRPDSLPGPIYVGGSPLFYLLSGRQPAIALSYGLDDLLPEQWIAFDKQLTGARPSYVFLYPEFHDWIQSRSPQTLRFIDQNYSVLQSSQTGTWYVLKGAGATMSTQGNQSTGVSHDAVNSPGGSPI
jgi:hypothetical protein